MLHMCILEVSTMKNKGSSSVSIIAENCPFVFLAIAFSELKYDEIGKWHHPCHHERG